MTLRRARLAAALSELSREERECLLLREQLGLTTAGIARTTGLSRERVRAALDSARERLRLALFAEGEPGAEPLAEAFARLT